ncbi:hypothetical protein [Devosia sp.]|uniref:hypothetical protein n=1 Tax=Devosia sp. TaxID=1871048 RepID=UPI003267C0A1
MRHKVHVGSNRDGAKVGFHPLACTEMLAACSLASGYGGRLWSLDANIDWIRSAPVAIEAVGVGNKIKAFSSVVGTDERGL